eukprot:1659936-Amphidinium_carterae.2
MAAALDNMAILKLIKYFCLSSGWKEGYRTFVMQNCRLFKDFDRRLSNESGEIHKLLGKHQQFKTLIDNALSKQMQEEFPQLSFKAIASAITVSYTHLRAHETEADL